MRLRVGDNPTSNLLHKLEDWRSLWSIAQIFACRYGKDLN